MKRVGPARRRRRPQTYAEQLADAAQNEVESKLDQSVADIGLSVRTVNTLEASNINSVRDLASKTRDELLAVNNFGEKTITECRAQLKLLGVPTPNWNRPPRQRRANNKKK